MKNNYDLSGAFESAVRVFPMTKAQRFSDIKCERCRKEFLLGDTVVSMPSTVEVGLRAYYHKDCFNKKNSAEMRAVNSGFATLPVKYTISSPPYCSHRLGDDRK